MKAVEMKRVSPSDFDRSAGLVGTRLGKVYCEQPVPRGLKSPDGNPVCDHEIVCGHVRLET